MLHTPPVQAVPQSQLIYHVKDTANLSLPIYNNTLQNIYYSGRTQNIYCLNGICGLLVDNDYYYKNVYGTIAPLQTKTIQVSATDESFTLNPSLSKLAEFFISFSKISPQDALLNNALENQYIQISYIEAQNQGEFSVYTAGAYASQNNCFEDINGNLSINCMSNY